MKHKKDKKGTVGCDYNKIGSYAWAFRKLWRLDRMYLIFRFAAVPVAVVLPLVQSLFTRELIDTIGLGAGFGQLASVCAGFVGAIFVLNLLQSFVETRRRSKSYYPALVYQDELSRKAGYETDFENTEKQDFREIYGYAWDDACRGHCALEFIWGDVAAALTHVVGIVTYASLLAAANPVVFLLVTAVSACTYISVRWEPMYYEKHKKEWEKERRKTNYLQNLSNDFERAKDIKLYGLEGWLDKMMRGYQAHILRWKKRCSLRGIWAAVFSGVMDLIEDGVAYIYLIVLLMKGSISVGDFVFCFGIVDSIATFITGVIFDIGTLSAGAEKIGYYRNLFDYPDTFNHGEGCKLPTGAVSIEFRDVWYRYAGAEDYTIKGLNLTVSPGESIALVGRNGAGKTTLVKLICGLYMPTRGEILIDGKRIDQYNIEEYYTMVSAVFQETKPAAFTIQEFVTSVAPNRPDAGKDAETVLQAAGLWERIQGLPHGMETHLGKSVYEDGVDFSGGEMQKLLLARAMYKDGAILVLDEPTAALDPIAENKVYMQYSDISNGKTSIYISHRFASTRFCDRIVLLQDGVIAESGSHEELMELGGQYAYMFDVQSKYYKEENHA